MKKNLSHGFTLLETLVAIAMLSIVISVVMGMIQNSLQSNAFAKDQITAKYLAEGGVEYIRNLRDHNVVNNGQSNWMDGIAANFGPCGDIANSSSNQTCYVDSVSGGAPQACSGMCPVLHYDTTNGQYSYDGSLPESKFTRTISVSGIDGQSNGDASAAYSVLVHVVINWDEPNGPQTYTVDEYLFNWYQK